MQKLASSNSRRVQCISGARRVFFGVELGSGIALQLSFGIAAQSYGLPDRKLLFVFVLAMFIFSRFVIAIALDVRQQCDWSQLKIRGLHRVI